MTKDTNVDLDLSTLFVDQNIESMINLLKLGKTIPLLVPTKANQIIEHQIQIWKTPLNKIALKSICKHNKWDVPLIYLYQVVIVLDSLQVALEKLILRIKSNSLRIIQCQICSKPTCNLVCFNCFPYIINNIVSQDACILCQATKTPTRFLCCNCKSRICFSCFSKSQESTSSHCSRCKQENKIIKRKISW